MGIGQRLLHMVGACGPDCKTCTQERAAFVEDVTDAVQELDGQVLVDEKTGEAFKYSVMKPMTSEEIQRWLAKQKNEDWREEGSVSERRTGC